MPNILPRCGLVNIAATSPSKRPTWPSKISGKICFRSSRGSPVTLLSGRYSFDFLLTSSRLPILRWNVRPVLDWAPRICFAVCTHKDDLLSVFLQMSWLPSRASISERFYANFEQINIPQRPVGNRGQFSNMSGFSNLTCVKLNWPISNLRSESERKYLNRTRTIAGSPPLARPVAIQKQKPKRRACFRLVEHRLIPLDSPWRK